MSDLILKWERSLLFIFIVFRDSCPGGYQLVDPDRSGKKTQECQLEPTKHSFFTRKLCFYFHVCMPTRINDACTLPYCPIMNLNEFLL